MNEWTFTRLDDASTLEAGGPGADYIVEEWEPYRASVVRDGDQDTPEGEDAGQDTEKGRPGSMTVSYSAYADRGALQPMFEALKFFFRPGPIVARHHLDNEEPRTRFVRCRAVDDPTPADDIYSQSTKVTFKAHDPHDYSDPQTVTVDDSTSVAVGGLRPTRQWVFVVAGPVTNPSLTAHRADGAAFTIYTPGVTMLTGDRWEVDGRTGDVRKWVTASSTYQYLLGGVVQQIQAGTSTFAFTSATGSDTGELTIRGCF